jgi:UDP-glucose 4-epimerase
LRGSNHEVVSLDIKPSLFTTAAGSITDRELVRDCMKDVQVVYHACTLHKPHIVTHSVQDFVDTNVSGTLILLEEAVAAGVRSFVFTSTTSVFGDALRPPEGAPAAWVTEELNPIPRNIYGVTKLAAENLCQLFHRNHGLNCIILRTSRFFPEEDDDQEKRVAYDGENSKTNEFLFRRVDLEDVVSAHVLASEKASKIGFGKYIVSATTPFLAEDLAELRSNAPGVLLARIPRYEQVYRRLGWSMFEGIDRVYVNDAARNDLGWAPKYDFARVISDLKAGIDPQSPLAKAVGSKGYHSVIFDDGPYPVE